ncbi:nuclear RNA export factor 1-like isoform X2 [Narcine bancroftii]|uniref:nuclear RNA export factor 1-like isoform X2 n=1 Tax=Narcine bancroftii TaxID=1343680 RepID=UPI00383218DB
MAEDGRHYSEHDDRVGGSFPVRRRKGRGPFRWKMYSDTNHKPRNRSSGASNPRLRFEDENGDVAMNDHELLRPRFSPYGSRQSRRPDSWHDREGGPSNIQVTMKQSSERGASNNSNTQWNWFKVTIPHGKKYDKNWLLLKLQTVSGVPFTPVQFHYDGHKAVFYVEDSTTADALEQRTRRIFDKDSYRIIVKVNTSMPPSSISSELKLEEIEHIKQCMSKRYDGSQQSLDLNSIRSDPDLASQNIEVVLNRRNSMSTVLKIIEENIPELLSLNLGNNKLYRLDDLADLNSKVPNLKILNLSRNELKSERDLDKIKGFKLEELWLEGNPLCSNFRDQAIAVREKFPKLLRLDGHELPPPISFDVETPTTLPPCKGSYFGTEEFKVIVSNFIQQYYSVYDSTDRQGLLDAYHDTACCSLSIPFSLQNSARSNLADYFKESRNVKKLKDPTLRARYLKHTRLNVVAFLNELPKTQHDIASFVVDVSTQTNTLLCFTVHGVFKDVDSKSRETVRAFSRVFIAVPAGNAGLCIVNDQLFIRNATTEEIRKAFVTPAPTPSSSPVPTLTAPQQEMLQVFSQQSGMNIEWSQKCLQDNEWDFSQAAQIFTQLKAEGKIPEIAFVKQL